MLLKEEQNKTFNVDLIRDHFPILKKKVNGHPLIYFDNGATTQKPLEVLDAIRGFYTSANANIHRGVHTLSREATESFEDARKTIAGFFNVPEQQMVFTAGTTDSLNIIASGLSGTVLESGDEVILSAYEHHSNILPWQLWAHTNNGKLKVIPLKSDQSLDLDRLESLISGKTKVISIAHVSNTLGLITDIERVKSIASKRNIVLVVDGAQSAPHMPLDIASMDPDFFVCSAHKMYGPTGTGVLYMKKKWMSGLSLSRAGGGTIKTVSFDKTEYAEGPLRFEAGTPNLEGVIGTAAAIKYLQRFGMKHLHAYETDLMNYAQKRLNEIPEVEMYGISTEKTAVISFNVRGAHPFDVGTLLDKYGIAVRTGHHCTQPLMELLCVPGTIRISFALYNTIEEIDYFIEKLKRATEMLK